MATYIFNGECPDGMKQAFIDAYGPMPEYHADTWYKYNGDTEWRTVSITGKINSSSIPNVTNIVALEIGSDVTSIGDSAFSNCTNLTNATIPDSVTSIGFDAFYNCTNLTSVIIPDSVTSIGALAFNYCHNLNNIIIPSDCALDQPSIFRDCSSMSTITFENKTMEQVQNMQYYPFGLNWYMKEGNYVTITNIICSDGTIQLDRYCDDEPKPL